LGEVGQIAPPFTFSETPAEIKRPPPDLGEHTRAVLSELGLDADEVNALKARGIV
jgi:crotonobetainyl-CoA:carnitine CoA-transferase CaiB-like acyl-CoA transferase